MEKHDSDANTAALEPLYPRPNYPIESVDNALRLLLLIEERHEIRVSEAAAAVGTAVSTAHRLLAMLQYHGLVRQEPSTKTYHLGAVLLRLGLSAVREIDIRLQARPYLERLRTEVGETVHLVLPQGTHVLFVDSLEGSKALRVASRTGMLMWAHCTSVGKAYLAYEPEAQLLAMYPNFELPRLTPSSITSRTRLFAQLAEVRDCGYAQNVNESEDGVGSIGAAVLGPHGRAVACVSTAIPLTRLTDERRDDIAVATMSCVREIGDALPW